MTFQLSAKAQVFWVFFVQFLLAAAMLLLSFSKPKKPSAIQIHTNKVKPKFLKSINETTEIIIVLHVHNVNEHNPPDFRTHLL